LHVWAFDLLALNGKDLRKWSLEARQGRLQALLSPVRLPRCPSLRKLRRRASAARSSRTA